LAVGPWQFRPDAKRPDRSDLPNDICTRRPAVRRILHRSYEDWRKLANGVLKGAPFEKLVGRPMDGLKIDPIYPRAQNAALSQGGRGRTLADHAADRPSRRWPRQRARCTISKTAPTGLTLVFAGANGAHGLDWSLSAEAVEKVLDGVSSMPE